MVILISHHSILVHALQQPGMDNLNYVKKWGKNDLLNNRKRLVKSKKKNDFLNDRQSTQSTFQNPNIKQSQQHNEQLSRHIKIDN